MLSAQYQLFSYKKLLFFLQCKGIPVKADCKLTGVVCNNFHIEIHQLFSCFQLILPQFLYDENNF
jgi:hypothetical protein